MRARRAWLKLLYDSADISADVAPFLRSATFTDNFNSADDLQITLADAEGLWRGDWFPAKGARLTATIFVSDWNAPGDAARLYCGVFFVDEVTAQGPEATVTVKARSVMVTDANGPGAGIQKQLKTRAWENTTLKTIAAQIAVEAGLKLHFQLSEDISYGRRDQLERSDLGFLEWLGDEGGFCVKVSGEKLIVCSRGDLEAGAPVGTVQRRGPRKKTAFKTLSGATGMSEVSSWSFSSSAGTQYKNCTVSWYDAAKKATYRATASTDAVDSGQSLTLSERAESPADAQRIAAARLKRANLSAVRGTLTMMGDVRMAAGVNITVEGFGVFDGRFFIDSAVHSVDGGGGYKTTIQVHRGEKK